MDTCPKCHRKLLSHASAKCNWCGDVIADQSYQEDAANERNAYFVHDRIEQSIETARIHRINPDISVGMGYGYLQRDPIFGVPNYLPAKPHVPSEDLPQADAILIDDSMGDADELPLSEDPLDQAREHGRHIEF